MILRQVLIPRRLLRYYMVPSTQHCLKCIAERESVVLQRNSWLCRFLASSKCNQERSRNRHEYRSDSYNQRHNRNADVDDNEYRSDSYQQRHIRDPGMNNGARKDPRGSLSKRLGKKLLFFTGGLFWVGVIVISFLGEEFHDFILQLKDSDEEVRMFAFYEVAQNQGELAQLLSKEGESQILEINTLIEKKGKILTDALQSLKKREELIQCLGAPVQFVGYRAAEKVDCMVGNFHSSQSVEEVTLALSKQLHWHVECILEGSKAAALVTLDFCRPACEDDWKFCKLKVQTLDRTEDHLLHIVGTLPNGIDL